MQSKSKDDIFETIHYRYRIVSLKGRLEDAYYFYPAVLDLHSDVPGLQPLPLSLSPPPDAPSSRLSLVVFHGRENFIVAHNRKSSF